MFFIRGGALSTWERIVSIKTKSTTASTTLSDSKANSVLFSWETNDQEVTSSSSSTSYYQVFIFSISNFWLLSVLLHVWRDSVPWTGSAVQHFFDRESRIWPTSCNHHHHCHHIRLAWTFKNAVTRGPREVAKSEILGDLGRSPNLKY